VTLHGFGSLGVDEVSLEAFALLLRLFEISRQLSLVIIIFRIVLKAVPSLSGIPLREDLILLVDSVAIDCSGNIVRAVFGLSFFLVFVDVNVYTLILGTSILILINGTDAVDSSVSILVGSRILLGCNLPLVSLHQVLLVI